MTERFCKKSYKMLDINSVDARSVLLERNAPYLCLYVTYGSEIIGGFVHDVSKIGKTGHEHQGTAVSHGTRKPA